MTIHCYSNSSPQNYVHKNLGSVLTSLTGVLRDNCSILDPNIEVDLTGISVYSIGNYAYISEFGRYYYLTGIVHSTNYLYTLQYHVDVLMSHWNKISSSQCIASRSSSRFQTKVADPAVPFSNEPRYVYYPMTKQASAPSLTHSGSYIVTIASPWSPGA